MVHKKFKKCLQKKNQLYISFLKSRDKESESRYKKYKNKLTTILRNCEKKYISNLLEKNKFNTKNTWEVLNNYIKKKKSHSIFPDHFKN